MKAVIGVIVASFVLLAIINSSFFFSNFSDSSSFTGRTLTSGITLFIESVGLRINITSPLNTTYNFNVGSQYLLELNVSSQDSVVNWRYKLEDLRHNTVVNESVQFTPNTTFTAVRWSNKLTVYGNNSVNDSGNSNVIFYVNVPNSAPTLLNLSTLLYACEASSLNNYFNVSDPDEDDLQVDISPKNPFFVDPILFSGQTLVQPKVYSGTLSKQDVGLHQEEVFVVDGSGAIDTKKVNITVIETNNPPTISNISGAYTLWASGDNSNIQINTLVSDIENGNNISSTNFTHNITFLTGSQFFTMGKNGIANIYANSSLVGVHNVMFCITDKALTNISSNISLCGETGLNKTSCKNFSVTITNENRQPTIVSYLPSNLNFSISGENTTNFVIRSQDPDGNSPDAYWYVDGVLVKYDPLNPVSNIDYSFGCGSTGTHTIKAEVTDGVLNDSVNWTLTLTTSTCPVSASGGGGGGGAGGTSVRCAPQWGCNDWTTCQNTEASLKQGVIGGEDYRDVKNECTSNTLGLESCGFQIRGCEDLNTCNGTFINKPSEIIQCYYTSNPSCSDKIKNCHDGLCEFLVDCGGPCGACSTCSDGIQNQGELGIDCGSPCPVQCIAKAPLIKKDNFKGILIILNLLLLIIILIIVARIVLKYLRSKLDENNVR